MTIEHDSFAGLVVKDDHLLHVLRGQDILVQDGGMGTSCGAGPVDDGALPTS